MEVNTKVSGKTNVYGIIGDPVEHSFSPVIHNTIAKVLEMDFVYVPFHVNDGDVYEAIKGAYSLNIRGMNVTVPHKEAVIPALCGIDKRAEAIGAVNTLKYTENGYFGYNTDIIGILYSLNSRGIYIKGKKVLIIGAGGSARAALVLAASEGADEIFIANRTLLNAQKLKDNILKHYNVNIKVCEIGDIYSIQKCDIVIQTTTLGFGDKVGISPISDKKFFEDKNVSAVFDTIYIPAKTKFLEDAESLGITAINGFDMLIYQGVAASEIWLERKFDNQFKENLKKTLSEV